jgi:hypothetical protein
MSAGFEWSFIFQDFLKVQDPELLLIGYNLYIIGSGSRSESQSLPFADTDMLHVYLDATVLAGGSIVDFVVAANTFPGVLVLLDH